MRHRGSRVVGCRGQALPEFAIAAIPLLFLLLGILQFGLIYNTQVGLTNAIRDAARFGSGLPATDAGSAAIAAESTYGRLTASLAEYVSPYDAANLATPDTNVCYVQHDDGNGAQPAFVQATAVYDHPLIIPLIGAVLDGLDGVSNDGYRISVTTEIRVDNPNQDLVSVGSTPVCYPP